MPLSDHEKRLLAEMEAALEQDDPRLVSTLTGKARTRKASRVLAGGVTVLVGMAIIISGLIAKVVPVGIAGFLVALAGLVLIFSNLSALGDGAPGQRGTRSPGPKKGGWSSRLEERWERRNNDQ
jgi:Protein of unknown function (DUF3040)